MTFTLHVGNLTCRRAMRVVRRECTVPWFVIRAIGGMARLSCAGILWVWRADTGPVGVGGSRRCCGERAGR